MINKDLNYIRLCIFPDSLRNLPPNNNCSIFHLFFNCSPNCIRSVTIPVCSEINMILCPNGFHCNAIRSHSLPFLSPGTVVIVPVSVYRDYVYATRIELHQQHPPPPRTSKTAILRNKLPTCCQPREKQSATRNRSCKMVLFSPLFEKPSFAAELSFHNSKSVYQEISERDFLNGKTP